MTSYRTALGRARGLGSAKHGVGHFIYQRVTAVLMVPLVLWAVWAVLTLAKTDYQGALAWMSSPVNAVLTTVLTILAFWHMSIGMQVVVEDYIHKPGTKAALLILNVAVCGLVGALAVFCILKVALGGGVT
jgi:succinate dehydrogenase / fumarate reductase membrane anchor subunit